MHGIIRVAEAARRIAVALLWCLGWQAAVAAGPSLLPESRFGFRATVEGERFEARLADYRVLPQLDAAGRPQGFEVEVDLRRVDSGDAERDAEMRRAGWFDVERYPRARFSSARVRAGSEGGLVAEGELQIKGVSRALAVPFVWETHEDHLQMRGRVELDRRWFGVGPADDSSVAAGVQVFFDLAWRSP